jgi:hypothetical protein
MGLKQGGLRGSLRNVSVGANVIPDSVVIQYYGDTWGQGDSTWVDDATDDGSQDMQITGDPQASTLSDGADSILADGSGDYGLFTLPSSFEGSSLNSFSIEVSLQWSNDNRNRCFGILNSGDAQRIILTPNDDPSGQNDPGNINFNVRDTNNNNLSVAIDGGASFNDGNRHDVTFIVNDASSPDVSLIVDGTSQPLAFSNQDQLTNFGPWDVDCAAWALNNGGSLQGISQLNIAAFRWHDSPISSQTIGEYQ